MIFLMKTAFSPPDISGETESAADQICGLPPKAERLGRRGGLGGVMAVGIHWTSASASALLALLQCHAPTRASEIVLRVW